MPAFCRNNIICQNNKKSCASRTKQNKSMFVSNCSACGKKKPKFIENQETCGFSSSLGIRTPISCIPFIDDMRG